MPKVCYIYNFTGQGWYKFKSFCLFSECTQTIITACAVLHNIAIQRKQSLPDDEINSPIIEVKGKEGAKRKYTVNTDMMQDPIFLMERNQFLQKHF